MVATRSTSDVCRPCECTTPASVKSWAAYYRYLPQIEAEVRVRKKMRLERERELLVSRRVDVVTKAVERFPDECRLPSTKYEPSTDTIQRYGAFFDYINCPSETFEEDFPADIVSAEMRRLYEDWAIDCERRLIIAARFMNYADTTYMSNARLVTPENRRLIDLATNVFTCPKRSTFSTSKHGIALFGVSDARIHMKCLFKCKNSDGKLIFPRTSFTSGLTYQVNLEGYKTMLTLLELFDLDPNLTLKSDLDALDPRVVCMQCFDKHQSQVPGARIRAFTWKECVSIYQQSQSKLVRKELMSP